MISSGRTQGTPQATVQVYHDTTPYGGVTTVNGDTPIDIGNGQTLTIATDVTEFSDISSNTSGTYTQAVTVNSDPSDFAGIGSGTYSVVVVLVEYLE